MFWRFIQARQTDVNFTAWTETIPNFGDHEIVVETVRIGGVVGCDLSIWQIMAVLLWKFIKARQTS